MKQINRYETKASPNYQMPVKVSLIVKNTHPWIDFVHEAIRLDHTPKKLKESQILLVLGITNKNIIYKNN